MHLPVTGNVTRLISARLLQLCRTYREFKLCLLVCNALNGLAPSYITDMLLPVTTLDRQVTLSSADNNDLQSLPEVISVSANVLLALQLLELGTVCHLMLSQQTLLGHFKKRLKTFLFSKHYFNIQYPYCVLCYILHLFYMYAQLVGTWCKLPILPCLDMI